MKRLLVLLSGLYLILTACSDGANQDSASEVACSTATGVYVVTTVTCDGSAVDESQTSNTSFSFTSATAVTRSRGSNACVDQTNWTVAHGQANTVNLTGVGNNSCLTNGSTVASCNGGGMTCNSTDSIDGFQNNFDTCAVSGTTMTIQRTVSSTNNPNNISYCTDGQVERITLTVATQNTLAELDIEGSDPASFGSVSVGGNSSLTLTMSNNGQSAASAISVSGLAAPYSFLGGSYPGTGGYCASTLAAGSSCTMVVQFAPTSAGASTDSIVVDYNDSSAAQQLTHGVSGTGFSGALANLTISGVNPFDYGSNPTGSVTSQSFTVTNSGSGTATSMSGSGLATPFNFQGGAYPGTGGTCGASLAAAASCTIAVDFSPVGTGLFADTIDINYNDGASANVVSRSVQGTGLAPALLVISDGPAYDFGNVQVGFTGDYTFTVTNTGGVTATSIAGLPPSAPFTFQGGAYPGVGGTCTSILGPGLSCLMSVRFSPTVTGLSFETLTLLYNDGVTTPSATRNILGNGTP